MSEDANDAFYSIVASTGRWGNDDDADIERAFASVVEVLRASKSPRRQRANNDETILRALCELSARNNISCAVQRCDEDTSTLFDDTSATVAGKPPPLARCKGAPAPR